MGLYKSTVVSGAARSLWASLTVRPVPSLLSCPQQKAKNEELIQLAEQRKREAERKKKEVEEKESATLRRQHERERRARVEEVGLLFTLGHNSDPNPMPTDINVSGFCALQPQGFCAAPK